jgi:hypothetical protein
VMQRQKGWRAPGSGSGYPHGKHKKQARRERALARLRGKKEGT